MRDPVLERDMFRKAEAAPSSDGVVSLVKGESDYERRKKQAMEMLAAAKERQNPENYKTLSEQSRPGVFRPVATGQPQAPQPNTQQQMAQMQAMGFRPVGMADGGYVQRFANGSGPAGVVPSYTLPEVISNWWTGDWGDGSVPPSEDPTMERVTLPGPRGPSSFMRPRTKPIDSPFPSGRADDAERGIRTLPQEEPKREEPAKDTKDTKDTGKPDVDLTLDEIRARRAENINLALIQAGLAMAGGQSPNALTNIAAGGISGLQAYSQAEKERRADLAEERKYREDRLSRIQRAEETSLQKTLTREQRTYESANSNIIKLENQRVNLEKLLSESVGDEAQKARVMSAMENVDREIERNRRVLLQSQRALGYTGEDIFSATAQTPVTPTIRVGDILQQGGQNYRVTGLQSDGKPITELVK